MARPLCLALDDFFPVKKGEKKLAIFFNARLLPYPHPRGEEKKYLGVVGRTLTRMATKKKRKKVQYAKKKFLILLASTAFGKKNSHCRETQTHTRGLAANTWKKGETSFSLLVLQKKYPRVDFSPSPFFCGERERERVVGDVRAGVEKLRKGRGGLERRLRKLMLHVSRGGERRF